MMRSEIPLYPRAETTNSSRKMCKVILTRSEDIKRLLAIYFEQNVTTDEFEDYDGERWVVLGEG